MEAKVEERSAAKSLTMGHTSKEGESSEDEKRKFLLTDKAIPVGQDIFTLEGNRLILFKC